jgi:hypothetical protein
MIGWDPQLNTYFAHVIDETKNEDDEGRDVLWIGRAPNEIHDIEVIKTKVSPYAKVPEKFLNKMYGDANG